MGERRRECKYCRVKKCAAAVDGRIDDKMQFFLSFEEFVGVSDRVFLKNHLRTATVLLLIITRFVNH